MRRNELDYILATLLDFRANVSDLIFTVDKPPQVEAEGVLVPVPMDPPIETLTSFQTEMIALNLIGGNPRLLDDLLRTGSCDTSYSVIDKARFRVNIFAQRGHYSIVLRKLNTRIATLEDLNLPEILHQPAKEKTGLVLVTGATGSGKSTTLAAILDEVNHTKAVHIVTLEDPVEFRRVLFRSRAWPRASWICRSRSRRSRARGRSFLSPADAKCPADRKSVV